MKVHVFALVLAVATVAGSVAVAAAPLTLSQVLRLVQARTPDQILAGEISERGIAEPVTQALIDRVRGAGAGRLTVDALDRLRPRSNLTIRGVPGAAIALDGVTVGRLDGNGMLVLSGLYSGDYALLAESPDHLPQSRPLSLPMNKDVEIEIRMESIYGSLTIRATTPSATIDIAGVSSFRGEVVDKQLEVGTYVVRVDAPGHEPYEELVEVESEKSTEREIGLVALPADQLAQDANRQLGSGNPREALAHARTALSLYPEQPTATLVAGHASYALKQFSDAVAYYSKAIQFGEAVQLSAKHRHRFFGGMNFCVGAITLTKDSFAFRSNSESEHSFRVLSSSIDDVELRGYFVHTEINVQKDGKERGATFDFVHPATTVREEGRYRYQRLGCEGCDASLNVLVALLSKVKNEQ